MKWEIARRLEDLSNITAKSGKKRILVIIDVLRFSTTAIYLLQHGARYIKPCRTIAEAYQFKREHENVILVGEKNGKSIQGFDFNNSPSQIEAIQLSGRPVAIRTSNGTRAIRTIGEDQDLYIGSTVNAKYVASLLKGKKAAKIYLVAVGRQGDEATEDLIGAKMIRSYAREKPLRHSTLQSFKERIRNSRSAQFLTEHGSQKDIEKVMEFNSFSLVPVLQEGVFVSTTG